MSGISFCAGLSTAAQAATADASKSRSSVPHKHKQSLMGSNLTSNYQSGKTVSVRAHVAEFLPRRTGSKAGQMTPVKMDNRTGEHSCMPCIHKRMSIRLRSSPMCLESLVPLSFTLGLRHTAVKFDTQVHFSFSSLEPLWLLSTIAKNYALTITLRAFDHKLVINVVISEFHGLVERHFCATSECAGASPMELITACSHGHVHPRLSYSLLGL